MAYRDADGPRYRNDPLNLWLDELDHLIKKLNAAERRKLMREIAQELQRRNRLRIQKNVSPENVAYVPRKGNTWDLRRLRGGETIRRHQKFNFFKEQDLELEFTREAMSRKGNPMIVGRRPEDRRPYWPASGFVREWIYVKKKGRGSKSKLRLFKKLPKKKWLRYKADQQKAAIGFMQGAVARIAAQHHYGENGLPSRELIGLPKADLDFVRATVIAHLENKQ